MQVFIYEVLTGSEHRKAKGKIKFSEACQNYINQGWKIVPTTLVITDDYVCAVFEQ